MWQPIETAPKDGILLGYDPMQDKRQKVATIFWCSDEGWTSLFSLDDNSYYTPSHWMPLPGPPK